MTPSAKTAVAPADAATRAGIRGEGSGEGGFAAVLEKVGAVKTDATAGPQTPPPSAQGNEPAAAPAPASSVADPLPVALPAPVAAEAAVPEPAVPAPVAEKPGPAPEQASTVEPDPAPAVPAAAPAQVPVPAQPPVPAQASVLAPVLARSVEAPVQQEAEGADKPGEDEPGKRKAVVAKAPSEAQVLPTAVPSPSQPAAPVPAPGGPVAKGGAHAGGEPVVHARAATAAPASPELASSSEAAPDPASGEARLSTSLFTQTLDAAAVRPALTGPASPYAPARPSGDGPATVAVREGRFGADIGVTIARAVGSGADGLGADLLIRLDPRHMGRVDVRLSFEHDGVLRAVVSADNPASLDLLRRESGDLGRALADAGVRSDGQSLRFDSGSSGSGGTGGQPRHSQRAQAPGADLDFAGNGSDDSLYRPLASSGHVDLMA